MRTTVLDVQYYKQYYKKTLNSYMFRTLLTYSLTNLSTLHAIQSGVPQGSILGPILYLLYTADLPETANTMTATYADDTQF